MKKIVLSVLLLLSYFGIASAQGISSDGRDFYLGFLYPSFNSTNAYSPYGNVLGFFGVYALISSYTDNQVTVSYFNLNTGAEEEIQSYNIMARRTVQVVLDINHMKEDPDGEQIEWRACHITAKKPVTITYFSTGSCSGGTYLALPTSTLGKEYVVESYHDNVGGIGGELSNEDAAGYFEIIAPYDGTTVQITAASTTRGNHRGVNCGVGAGTPAPWTISLNRGQTYMVKSAANDPNCSISGSTVVSDKPVAVIAGHENAITDGSDINPDSGRIDARNFMIEQMIPVQYWDSTGYVSIPLWNSIPDSTRGKGDEYDFFSSIIPGVNSNALGDTILATVLPASAQTIIASPYMEPEPRMLSVREPIEAHSLTSKKIHVVQYGQRAFSPGVPLPAPSQMSIIPMSLWRHSYLMFVPSNTFENFAGYYINVICDKNDFNQNHIHLAQNAGTLGQLVSGNVMLKKKNDSIPNFPNLMGVTLALSPGAYYLTGDSLSKPFMVYYYGFRALDPTRDLGSNNGDDFYFSYASPGGLNVSGNGGSLSVTVDTLCAKWHVCVHDGRKSGAGIKSIQLLVDPAGDFTKPTQVYNNVQFDPANYDVATPYLNEIDLPGSDTSYCFDVLVKNPLLTAYGPIYVVDNAGNATIVTLNYTAPNLKLMFKPSYANGVDTLIFPHTLPNKDTCATVYYYNSGKPTDPALQINAVSLRAHDASFSITNVSPAPPVSLKPGDTMSMTVCFHSKDTTVHIDTLLLEAPCFHSVVTLVGPGGSPFIYTTDKDFGPIIIGETRCDTMTVRNLGNMSFTVTGILLHDTNHFKIDTSGTSKFPIVVVSGRLTHFSFCFTPDSKALDSTTVDFLTDMEGPYKDSIKSWSFLKGSGVDTTSGVTQTSLEQTQLSAFIEANRLIVHVADNLELGEKFELYDLLGRCVAEWGSVAAPDANGYIVLPMPNVSSGVYLLRVGANSCKVLR